MKKFKFPEGLRKKATYFTPQAYKKFLQKQMAFAGLSETVVSRFIGFSFFFSIFLGAVIGFDLWLLDFGLLGITIGVGVVVISLVLSNVLVILVADSRATEIEKVLPDALQLMSANVRAGMTIDKALWLSARPEFGILEEEIKRAGAKTIAGKPLKTALTEMAAGINSEILDRTVKLIIEGIESGGELAHLLEEIAGNIRVTQSLRQEIKASVTTYSLFILFAAGIGAPLLFAISLFFVETMAKLYSPSVLGSIETTGAAGGFGGGGFLSRASAPTITADQLFLFAISSIAVTTIFGSLIIGLIQSGQEKKGLKFVPILLTISLVIFFVAQLIIKSLFGGFFENI